MLARNRCEIPANSAQTTATLTMLHCQSMRNNNCGTIAPANIAPKGTPVCLIENTKDI